MLTINSHSLETLNKSETEWASWFHSLKLAFRLLGIKPSDVIWTFDDFYCNELESVFLLDRFGFQHIIVFYCAGLLGKNDARMELGNRNRQCCIGTRENLKALKSRFPNLQFGIHTLSHADYTLATSKQLSSDLSKCQAIHLELFNQEASLFAFPFGRATDLCIAEAYKECEFVYLSDNRIPYSENAATVLINRVHLELGGSIFKFLIKMLFSRMRRKIGVLLGESNRAD